MSDAPEQAMKRANATDSAEYRLATMYARDCQERLAKRHPARWRLLKRCSPVSRVAVSRENRRVTIEALADAGLLRLCEVGCGPEAIRFRRWWFTGWGLMVREEGLKLEAEREPEAGVYTRTEAKKELA